MKLSYLPDSITVKGKTLKPVIGQDTEQARANAKAAGKLYRTVTVKDKRLNGRVDLHGKPYPGISFLFVEV